MISLRAALAERRALTSLALVLLIAASTGCSGNISSTSSTPDAGFADVRVGIDSGASQPDATQPLPPDDAGVVDAGIDDVGASDLGAPDQGPTYVDGQRSHPGRKRVVGTNLGTARYWGESFPFVNLMHMADGWIAGTRTVWNDGSALDLDEHGWVRRLQPGQEARIFIVTAEGGRYAPTGVYTVVYDGQGEMEYDGQTQVVEEGPGRALIEVTGSFWITIRAIDPSDPIRNLAVYLPGGRCEEDDYKACQRDSECTRRCVPFPEDGESKLFNPVYLAEIEPYSILRFMDWMDTNRNIFVPDENEPPPVVDPEDYPSRDDAFWHPVPVSVMMELANTLDAAAWVNIPHTASDRFVQWLAAETARHLERELDLWVEHSNEVWNSVFDQYFEVNAAGCRRYSADPVGECSVGGVVCDNGPWDETQARCRSYGRRYHAERSVRIGRVFRQAFAGNRPERVQRVLGTQVGEGRWFVPELLEVEVDGQPAWAQIDAVAVAPYFGSQLSNVVRSADELYAPAVWAPGGQTVGTMCRVVVGPADAEWGGVLDWMVTDLEMLETLPAEADVAYVGYEGGHHLWSFEDAQTAALEEMARDPRMYDAYLEYFHTWNWLTGGAPLVHFASAGNGVFGELDHTGQPLEASPRAQAIRAFIGGAPSPIPFPR